MYGNIQLYDPAFANCRYIHEPFTLIIIKTRNIHNDDSLPDSETFRFSPKQHFKNFCCLNYFGNLI